MKNYEKYARITDELYNTYAVDSEDIMNNFSYAYDEIGAAYGLAGLFDEIALANKVIKETPNDKKLLTKIFYNIANGAILNIMQLKSFEEADENKEVKPKQIINEEV
jgi:hypothetical protein